ncbi:MAG: tetratricopeptide repeat protein [Cellvibrionaceae bacterium]
MHFFRDKFPFIFLSLSVALTAVSAQAEKPLSSVADLRYGVVLYDYFQGKHFDALSELMVAKERGGIQGHKDNPELIEGSINLAFGMDKRAGTIFDRLLDESKPLDVRNAAWFYLSKIRYQRGEYEAVRESLTNISDPSPELVDEIEVMEIQLLLTDQKYDEAEQRLAAASSKATSKSQFQYWRPYLNFNIGAIYARLERMEEAQDFFSKVARERLSKNSTFHREQFSLYDKAYTAAGYGYFQDENYKKAAAEFENVRQNAPLANDALLGYGWAKARLGDYQAALAPWLLLSEKPLADDAVQEALLAIPYAYLQLGDTAKALERYAYAEQIYSDELKHIDETGSEVQAQSIVELLDLDNPETSYSWLSPEKNTLVKSPSRYLLPLYSYNRFQNTVQTLVDLQNISRRLEAWKTNLDAYDDLMEYRLTTFRKQQQPEGYQGMQSQLAELKIQRDQLASVLSEAKQQENVFLLLDEERKDLLDMVASGEKNIERLSAAGEFIEEESDWIQRYRGMLLWSATLDFDDRLWQFESKIKAVDKALASSTGANQKINSLLVDAPDIARAQTQIEAYSLRVDGWLENNNVVMAGLEEELRSQIYATLALQRQRVQFYLGEARLAVAQLYDNQYLDRSKAESAKERSKE